MIEWNAVFGWADILLALTVLATGYAAWKTSKSAEAAAIAARASLEAIEMERRRYKREITAEIQPTINIWIGLTTLVDSMGEIEDGRSPKQGWPRFRELLPALQTQSSQLSLVAPSMEIGMASREVADFLDGLTRHTLKSSSTAAHAELAQRERPKARNLMHAFALAIENYQRDHSLPLELPQQPPDDRGE